MREDEGRTGNMQVPERFAVAMRKRPFTSLPAMTINAKPPFLHVHAFAFLNSDLKG
jgi:hypothetical protein